jgi:hypothetical protein|uniref:Uncharacterized protein n=1 Tax=Podoviridae sp. ctxkP1 TaxID=2826591 RepID=A0A8S5QT13_9CAUD|nr:MAG TPA: hypothetical protein [Podoviridae sp. ctxkP1]
MEKDRATEYWDNEIKRAAEDTAKAYMEFLQAQKEEFEALNRQLDAEENNEDAETKEEACEIHRQKSFISAQKWEAYLMLSKWECITRDAAAFYKKRKASNEAYK